MIELVSLIINKYKCTTIVFIKLCLVLAIA